MLSGPFLTLAIVAVVIVLLLMVRARRNSAADSTFPASNPDPGGPVPGETSSLFEWPNILGDVLPPTPQCELAYPFIYTQLSQYLGDCEAAGPTMQGMEAEALEKARHQAAHYCLR